MERFDIEGKGSYVEGVWGSILEYVKTKVTRQAYETWFSETIPLSIQDGRLIVQVPNEFYIDWLDEHYSDVLKSALETLGLSELKIVYRPAPKDALDGKKKAPPPPKTLSRLQKRYTFENFVVGKSNQFAYAASKAVAESPASQYNPLFVYGGVGLGKTHLLQAIGNYVKTKKRQLKVFFTPAENFMNEMVRAIQTRSMVSFKMKYRQIDLLLFDDIQFLGDKEMLQEEIFHTFNSLYDAGKQIVMTSDRPPKEIAALEERLVSRFQWGLVVDIKPPDLETRMAILRKKAEEEGLILDDEIVGLIAKKVKKSVRDLEGCLIRLAAVNTLINRPITPDVVEDVIKDIVKDTVGVEADDIIDIVSDFYKVSVRDIRGKTRRADIVLARQIAMYLCREILGMPLKRIGITFGGKDHTTVMHSIEKIHMLCRRNGELREKLRAIKDRVSEI